MRFRHFTATGRVESAGAIHTARLVLQPATLRSLRGELESMAVLARELDVEVPATWPPEFYDADAVRWSLAWLEKHYDVREWGFYYVVEQPTVAGGRPVLVGAGGYKGPPDPSGSVEIGYAIVAERRRRGYAREAVYGWLERAFGDPRVTHVVAHTLEELTASIGVLRSVGFEFVGPGQDPREPAAIRFELSRARYLARRAAGVTAVTSPDEIGGVPPT